MFAAAKVVDCSIDVRHGIRHDGRCSRFGWDWLIQWNKGDLINVRLELPSAMVLYLCLLTARWAIRHVMIDDHLVSDAMTIVKLLTVRLW